MRSIAPTVLHIGKPPPPQNCATQQPSTTEQQRDEADRPLECPSASAVCLNPCSVPREEAEENNNRKIMNRIEDIVYMLAEPAK